jgi:hypothetical protein
LLKASLLEDYEPFDPNRETQSELPDSKLAMLEDRFLSNFRLTMEKANFTMLTGEEAETAASSNFLNTVPIVPEWLKMDPLFKRYMELHPQMAQNTYEGESLFCLPTKRIWFFFKTLDKDLNVCGFFTVVLGSLMRRVCCSCKSWTLC